MEQDKATGAIQEPIDQTIILQRIDAIAQELLELRRMVSRLLSPEPSSLTLQLLGCLGSEPVEAYNYDLDVVHTLQRFFIEIA